MEIKKVEKLLNISRSNVRFYEKEGLIHPRREGNNYRDYSDGDVAMLKKIIVLRKLGFTVEEIKKLQNGEIALSDTAIHNSTRLEAELEELKTALELSKTISINRGSFDTLDTDYYWNAIKNGEESGEKFADIYKDCLIFESEIFDHMWKYVFFHDFKKSKSKHGVVKAVVIILVICIIRGIARVFWGNGTFLEGFLYPFEVFVIASAILLPIYFLSKKSPKAAKIIMTVIYIVGIIFILAIVGILLVGLVSFFIEWVKKI